MEHDDREYTDMLNEGLKDVEPGAGLHSKVRNGIARNVVHLRHRNTALGAVAIAIVLTMALGTVTPVFGRNGTLPQVIAAMAAERQAKKMSKTLGKSPVEQTGTALQTSVTTVQAVSDSALSETDGVLALVIANKSKTPVADVLKLRATGLGWGRIMAQLNVSGRDIGKAMSQVETVAVASSPSAASQGQGATSKPAVSNDQQARGQVTAVSATMLRIEGYAHDIVLNADTKVEQVGAGTTSVGAIKVGQTVQVHVILSSTTYTAQQVHIEDKYVKLDTPSDEDGNQPATPSNEHTAVNNEQQARGKVIAVTAATLRIDGFAHDIILNADTKVEQVGAGTTNIAAIKVGQTVQVHVILSGATYTAQQVHIEDAYVKTDTTANEDQQGTQPASNEQQARGKVTVLSATVLHIDGFANDIILNADTKVEQVGAGTTNIAAIKLGQTVQVHVSLMGTTYTATQVHIDDKYVKPDKGNGKN